MKRRRYYISIFLIAVFLLLLGIVIIQQPILIGLWSLLMISIGVSAIYLFKYLSSQNEIKMVNHWINESRESKIETGKPTIIHSQLRSMIQSFDNLRNQLTEADQQRTRLISDVAHELRTPLSILRTQMETLIEKEEIESVDLIPLIDEIIRMSRLIQDLQNLTLAKAGRLKLSREWISIESFLCEIISFLELQALEKGIQLLPAIHLDGEVYWDSSRMKQVLINLIGNAIQYAGDDCQVRIEAQINNGICQMIIRDNGPGISPEKLPYLFDRFYRVDESRNRLSGGTGIGLAIAKEFVELHEGEILVESELGEGTSFYVRVPLFPKE